jgi:hypothetical protein
MSRTSKRRPTPPRSRRQPEDPAQSDRFIAKAREIEADANPKIFERAFRKIALGHLSKRIREVGPVD